LRSKVLRYKLGYALAATLCAIGLVALLFVIWKTLPEVSDNTDPVSAFWEYLWEEQLDFIPGVKFKPVYLVILATIMLTAAVGVFAFSRQRLFIPDKTIKLQCPFCKKYWRASYDRGQVLCPHCSHLVHPRMVVE